MAELFGRRVDRAALGMRTGELAQVAGIAAMRFDDGRARGVRAFSVRSGAGLEFTAIADRALDIASASFRGIPLAWHGPGGLAAAPFDPPDSGEFAYNFFGGLMTTCGLTAFGPPGSDRWGTWGQHGRINHVPAESICAQTIWEGARCTFEISGTMREACMFGEALRLERRLRAELGSNVLHVHDRVTNEGGASTPHMLLYHCNAGYPLLDETSELSATHRSMRPRDASAARGLSEWNRGGPPQADFAEQVFIHEPLPDETGWASAQIVNARLGAGLRVAYRPEQLPALVTWRMLGYKTYVMAMEPANCPTIEGRVEAAKRGTLPFIEPGETREYELKFETFAP